MRKTRSYNKLDKFAKYFAVISLVVLGGVMQFRWVIKNQSASNPFKAKYVKKAMCSHCDGRGMVPFFMDTSELRECPICYGAGARLVKINPEFQQSCPSCFALGRLYNQDTHHGVTCFTCLGRGAILRGFLQPSSPPDNPPATNAVPKAPGEPDDV